MSYKYYLPDGSFYTVNDDVPKEQVDDLVRQKHPELFTPPESTMGGAFEHGLKSLASQVGTLVQAPFYGADEAARRAMRRERGYTEEYGTGASLDKLGKTYEEQGVLPAAKELLHQSGLALAENAPQLGLMALSGGFGGLPGVAASTYLPRLAGGIESQAVEQQAQGKPIDVDVAKAAGYAVPQAALDVAAQAIPMGRTLAGKMFGPEVEKLLSIGATKDAEIAARNALPSIVRGVGKNLVTQELIQPAQVALARMENGQDLTSPDAFKDYGSAAYTAALLSPMGAVEGIHERSAAKDRIAAEQAKQAEVDRKAEEQTQPTAPVTRLTEQTESLFEPPTPEELAPPAETPQLPEATQPETAPAAAVTESAPTAETTDTGQDQYKGLVDKISTLPDSKWVTPAFVARELDIEVPQAREILKTLEGDGYIANPNKAGWYKPAKKAATEETGAPNALAEETENAPVTQPDTGRNDRPVISEQPVERGTPASTGEPVPETRTEKPSAPEVTASGLDDNKPPVTEPAGGERGSSDTLKPEPIKPVREDKSAVERSNAASRLADRLSDIEDDVHPNKVERIRSAIEQVRRGTRAPETVEHMLSSEEDRLATKEAPPPATKPKGNLPDWAKQVFEEEKNKGNAPRPQMGEGATNGTDKATAQGIVDKLTSKWKNAPKINVVGSASELPEHLRTGHETARGLYDPATKTVHIISSNARGADAHASIKATLFHEALGHFGLDKAFGKDLDTTLNNLYKTNKTLRTYADEWLRRNPNAYKNESDRVPRAVEEALAELSELGEVRNTPIGIRTALHAISTVIRKFLSKMGIPLSEYSDKDIQEVFSTMQRAHEQVLGPEATAGETKEQKVLNSAPPKSGTGVATEAASKIQEAHDAGNPEEELERFGDADLHLQSIDATRAEQARGAISRMGTMLKDAVQDAMSVYQKYQLYKDKLPSLKSVDEQINRAGAKLNNRQKEINDQVAGWLEATKKFPKQVMDNFNRIAVLSTLDQVEFFDDPVRKRKKEVDNPLVKQFEALPPELQEMYKTIRNKYEDLIQEYNELLTERMTPDDAKEFNLKYAQKKLKVYLPLFRRGEFWLAYTDEANNRVRQSFTSEYARNAEEARVRKEGHKDVEIYRNIDHMRENSPPPTGFLGDILKVLKDQKITDPDILNAVYETYLDYQPASSLRQRFRKRERRLGMEADILNAYSNVGGTMNRLVNSIEHAAGFDEAMAKLYEEAEANKSDSNIKAVVNSVRKQVEFARNPKTSKWAQMLGYGSYMWYLAGNASSAFINATHLPMVVYPMLGGKHGYGETSAAFKKAWSSINLKPDGEIPKGYEGLYNYANELGALGTHIGQEMFELRKISTNSYNGTFAKAKYGMDYMFRAADKLNREVALISAYELELKRTNGNVDAARQAAVDTVKTAYGSALAGAKAPIFQNNIARVALTFKSFAVNRAFILGKMFHDAFKGADKQTKAMARRQILGVYATAFAFSGVAGLPLVGFTEFLANQLMGDEDDPYDAEAEVRKASGDWAYKGPLNSLLNVEVSERTGWNDMIMKDDPKRLADVSMLSYIMEHSMGPMYNAVSQAGEAYDYFKQGKYERMFEATLPTAIRNGLKGIRYATEGARTTKGVPIGEVSGYNAVMQMAGLAPADITEKRKINTAMDVEQQKLLNRYNAIVAQTVGAYNLGSPEAIADAQEAAAKWSSKHPEKPITPNVISAAMKREERKAQDAINGMSLNKRLAPELLEQQGLDMQGNKTY